MGRWAQAQRTGKGIDPLGWYMGLISDIEFGSTIIIHWTSQIGDPVWFVQLDRWNGAWVTVFGDYAAGDQRQKDTGLAPGTLWEYRARIRAWNGSAYGAWSPWYQERSP